MKLLPDIEINGHTVSLQDPFVIDDYLVTEVQCFSHGERIAFKYGNYRIEFNMYEFSAKVRSALSNYTDSNITSVPYCDDLGCHTFDYQILCDFRLFYHWFYSRLNTDVYESIRRLVNQERLYDRYSTRYVLAYNVYKLIGYRKTNTNGNVSRDICVPSINSHTNYYYRNSVNANLSSTASSRLVFYSNGQRIGEGVSDIREIEEIPPLMTADVNYCEFTTEKDYIHDWNYKPDYIKHFMDGENKRTTLLLGAEIEVGGNDDVRDLNIKNSVVKKCIQIINGSKSDKEDLIYSTHDGTVQIELDTMPCSLEYHKNKMNYKEMFKYLDDEGYKGHDCITAGLHIHANRDYLGKTKLQQELVISKILYIIEKFNDNICIIARRNNDYSKFVGDRAKEDTALILFDKYKREGKRAALNLEHKDTIEFRMFKSTLKYETFILTLEFVKNIIDFAKSVSIEEIENMNWNDLMKTFSKDLQQYYTDRYNKAFKKMIDKDLDKKIEFLKKEIERKKKDIKMKIGGPLGVLSSNRQLSDLQKQLKKCESDKNKAKNKDKKFLKRFMDYYNRRSQLINPNINPNNNTNAFMREYYSTPVPF